MSTNLTLRNFSHSGKALRKKEQKWIFWRKTSNKSSTRLMISVLIISRKGKS